MTQVAGESNLLTYATGTPPELTRRAWKALFWVGIVHFAAFVVMLALTARGVLALFAFLHGQPVLDWYVIALLIQQFGMPVLGMMNLLAVAGYAAGMRGASPRRWFLIYVPTQLGLMVIQYAIAIVLVAGSPHQMGPSSSLGTTGWVLVFLPVGFVVLAVPLVLLLFPKIRRDCFAG
jgi:hypothetical protein